MNLKNPEQVMNKRHLLTITILIWSMVSTVFGQQLHPTWKVWKTIRLGTYKDAGDFKSALQKEGIAGVDLAIELMDQPTFTVSPRVTQVKLVIQSVADLGFNTDVPYDQICFRAKERGLELCPPEAGPQLRLQYKDQPRGEWLVIASGAPNLFLVGHDDTGRLWLGADYFGPDRVWSASARFVFVAPRN